MWWRPTAREDVPRYQTRMDANTGVVRREVGEIQTPKPNIPDWKLLATRSPKTKAVRAERTITTNGTKRFPLKKERASKFTVAIVFTSSCSNKTWDNPTNTPILSAGASRTLMKRLQLYLDSSKIVWTVAFHRPTLQMSASGKLQLAIRLIKMKERPPQRHPSTPFGPASPPIARRKEDVGRLPITPTDLFENPPRLTSGDKLLIAIDFPIEIINSSVLAH